MERAKEREGETSNMIYYSAINLRLAPVHCQHSHYTHITPTVTHSYHAHTLIPHTHTHTPVSQTRSRNKFLTILPMEEWFVHLSKPRNLWILILMPLVPWMFAQIRILRPNFPTGRSILHIYFFNRANGNETLNWNQFSVSGKRMKVKLLKHFYQNRFFTEHFWCLFNSLVVVSLSAIGF